MKLDQMASAAGETVARAFDPIKEWSELERVLSLACASSPLFMIWFDSWTVREAISSFFDMENAVAYYVPLTMASMMFITNGVIKHRHAYNWMLGVALLGIVVLDQDAFTWPHRVFVALFFGGNALVILYSRTKAIVKVAILGAGLAFFMAGLALDGWKLFWLEWGSLWVIAIHYFLEARKQPWYEAPGTEHAAAEA